MATNRKRLGVALIGAALSMMLVTSGAAAATKERLTIGLSQYPATLSPVFETMMAKAYVLAMTRRPITAYDQDWEPICLVCTALPSVEDGTAVWKTAENGNPGIAISYTLHPDAVWGDGTPVTTDDVLLSVDIGQDPQTGALNAELFRRIERVDVQDDKTFTLHLNKRTCSFESISGLALLPSHIERPIYEADPESYRRRTAYDADPTNPGLWFGPYRIARVAVGQSILLERNPEWWGPEPYFDEIEIRAIQNTSALIANLLAGDIDMIAGELGLQVDQALSFESRNGDDFQFIYRPGLVYEHIDVNLDNPALADLRVRQALIHAIDRKAISEQLFQGKQPVAHGNVNPLDKWYDPDVPKYDYDPQKAVELLKAAGWEAGADGIREKDGQRLTIPFQTTAENKTRELVQQVIQNQWRAIGIEAELKNQPPRVFFSETVTKRAFEGVAMYAWLSAPESVPLTTLHSSQIPTEQNAWQGQNYPGYASPEMDQTIDRLETDCADEDQRALWSDLQKRYAEDLPVLPLYFRAEPYILPKNLTGLRPTGHQFPSSLWVEEWRLTE
ncbi:MAG: peptide ABC transporter substrate-binding protein [Alphaproteobacteria bacterium]|nr:peptide ABC transporter substrate-binding protein [Alphaproteobacteria bacterium]